MKNAYNRNTNLIIRFDVTGLHYFERECKENKGEENERKGRTEVYHETIVQCGRNPNWS